MIRHFSFKHGWFYHYRVHSKKVEKLCNSKFLKLNNYLNSLFDECPEEPFYEGPRCSKLRCSVNADLKEIKGHEISQIAEVSHENQRHLSTAHSRVQLELLEKDGTTLAAEVPIWLYKKEIKQKIEGPLSGHIDVLRIENNNIWVWDYKPNAHREKYADTQTFLYALMLSHRSKIPLKNFRCGFFDEKKAFVFEPKIEMLKKITKFK